MAAQITYRASTTPTVPSTTTAKGSTLTTDEMDGNFKSIQNELNTLGTQVQNASVGYEQTFLLMGA